MKKQVISVAMAAMLMVSAAVAPVKNAYAATVSESTGISQNQSDTLTEVEADLQKSAAYMMTNLENVIFAADYKMSYTDYQDAMYAMKAGAENAKVIEKLNAVLKEKMAAYDETFLNPYGSTGVQSFALANVILYLEEQGVDVTAYEGINLIEKLEAVFLAEAEPNPYVYPYISAIAANTGKLSDTAVNKVKESVLASYVDNESGTGIDYWGVSADNNGQVLTALVNDYAKDADIKAKVDAALAWNATQKDASGAIVSWGTPSSSATAMAMRASAQFDKMDDAQVYYNAMAQFQSAANPGAYTYAGEDSIFSSRDALIGLLAYRNKLQGKDLFAVTNRQEAPETSEEPQTSADPQTTEETKPSDKENESAAPNASAGPQQTGTQTASAAPNTTQPVAPKTADSSHIGFLMAAMAASVCAVVITKKNKKDSYEQD